MTISNLLYIYAKVWVYKNIVYFIASRQAISDSTFVFLVRKKYCFILKGKENVNFFYLHLGEFWKNKTNLHLQKIKSYKYQVKSCRMFSELAGNITIRILYNVVYKTENSYQSSHGENATRYILKIQWCFKLLFEYDFVRFWLRRHFRLCKLSLKIINHIKCSNRCMHAFRINTHINTIYKHISVWYEE